MINPPDLFSQQIYCFGSLSSLASVSFSATATSKHLNLILCTQQIQSNNSINLELRFCPPGDCKCNIHSALGSILSPRTAEESICLNARLLLPAIC